MKKRTFKIIRNPLAMIGLIIAVALILAALFATYIVPYAPNEIRLKDKLSAPTWGHLCGTDQFGRDILSRIVYGARISLIVGLLGTSIGLVIGVFLGVITGYFGGLLDEVIMRAMDVILSFPYIVLGIGLMALFGPSLKNVIFIIGIINAPRFARLMRGTVLSVREREYVKAARSVGASNANIILHHIIPNAMTPVIILFTLSIATAINMEAALSFLGLGVPPPDPTWGEIISNGLTYMLGAPWIATFPGIAISLAVLGFNLFGDALRDIIDVKMD